MMMMMMNGLPVFTLSGLSEEIQRSPYHEWKDSESGHVMSYNQIVSQCTFTLKNK